MRERTLSSACAFDGRLLRVESLDVELADGTRSVREVVCVLVRVSGHKAHPYIRL